MVDLPRPYRTFHLPPDVSGTFSPNPLWEVHLLRLLEDDAEIEAILELAAAHVAVHGWSTARHRHHPTTDFAVDDAQASQMHV